MVTTIGAPGEAAPCRPARTSTSAASRADARAAGASAPTRCRPPPADDDRERARPVGDGRSERLGRVEHELVRARVVRRGPPAQQLGEVAADAGRVAAELAGVDGDLHAPRQPCGVAARGDRRRLTGRAQRRRARSRPRERARREPARARRRAAARRQRCRCIARPAPRHRRDRHEQPGVADTSGSAPRSETTTGTPTSSLRARAGRSLRRTTAGRAAGAGVERRALRVGIDVAGCGRVRERWPVERARSTRRPSRRARPASTSGGASGIARQQPRVGVEQPADVLSRLQRADEQEITVDAARRRVRAGQAGAPGRQTVIAVRSARRAALRPRRPCTPRSR